MPPPMLGLKTSVSGEQLTVAVPDIDVKAWVAVVLITEPAKPMVNNVGKELLPPLLLGPQAYRSGVPLAVM